MEPNTAQISIAFVGSPLKVQRSCELLGHVSCKIPCFGLANLLLFHICFTNNQSECSLKQSCSVGGLLSCSVVCSMFVWSSFTAWLAAVLSAKKRTLILFSPSRLTQNIAKPNRFISFISSNLERYYYILLLYY